MKSISNILSLFLVAVVFSTHAFTVAQQQTFHGNSQLMFDKVLEGSPFVFRNKIRSKVLDQLGSGNVSEKDLIEAIKKTTPPMFLSKALDTAKLYQSQQQHDDNEDTDLVVQEQEEEATATIRHQS
jgi:hypothetical protein